MEREQRELKQLGDVNYEERITHNLKYYYTRSGMTQKELAAACGMSEATVSMYLQGKRVPGFDALRLLASALDVEMSRFLMSDATMDVGDRRAAVIGAYMADRQVPVVALAQEVNVSSLGTLSAEDLLYAMQMIVAVPRLYQFLEAASQIPAEKLDLALGALRAMT